MNILYYGVNHYKKDFYVNLKNYNLTITYFDPSPPLGFLLYNFSIKLS